MKIPRLLTRASLQLDPSGSANAAYIPVRLSSETPAAQSYGGTTLVREVLLHGPENIDMSRAERGLPLIASHEGKSIPVGRIRNLRVEDRALVGDVYFSGRQYAQELRQDIEDGIVTDVSVGYAVTKVRKEKGQAGQPDTYYAVRWRPHEGSIVGVGADGTAGFYRSESAEGDVEVEVEEEADASQEVAPTETPETSETISEPVNTEVTEPLVSETTEDEAPETSETAEPVTEVPAEPVVEPETATEVPAEPVVEVLETQEARNFEPENVLPDDAGNELHALRSLALKLGFYTEQEIEQTLQNNSLEGARSLLLSEKRQTITEVKMPLTNDILGLNLARALKGDYNADSEGFIVRTGERSFDAHLFGTRANEMTTTDSSEVIYEQNIGFIDMLKAKSCVLAAGAKTRSGSGAMSYIRQTGTVTTHLRGENPGTSTANSELSFEKIGYTPKAIVAKVILTDELQMASAVDLLSKVRSEMISEFGLAIDKLALLGSSSPATAGLLKTGSGIQEVEWAKAGQPTYQEILAMRAKLDQYAGLDGNAWVMTPELKAYLEGTPKFAGGSIAIVDGNLLNGTKVLTSTHVPTNTGVLGAWSNLEIALIDSTKFSIDTQTYFDQGLTIVTARQYVDIGLLQPKGFVAPEPAL